ncbi:class I SAM-dependent methyltransferase [Bacillus vallismortis]|uniref:class I SAM-dependent methyltransferase n=1 Tax=Bacillus vallismortis TaxID=72361 RepID=UPI002091E4CA|nr:class I SAM-dependent methyltransferase [Bacillus vallismortis]MCO4850981.1 class I SAM-dependent methyltransferase [Bacillus vallismortis]
MRKNESSLTSLISAYARAYHSRYDTSLIFDDFIAKDLINEEEFTNISENMIQGISFFNKEIADRLQHDPEEILKWVTQVQLSPTPLARASYCEKVLHNELMLGAKQYVILGAGLDTFCFRHPELENTLQVFEVDHPATQQFKKSKLKETKLTIPDFLHFVPMDFTKTFSYQPLINEGFENIKTFFSLLGVSYYITKEENASLITQLFSHVPSGSSIVFDYADETLFTAKGKSNRVEHMVKMAAASGEPMTSCFTYQEMEQMLESAGLLIYEHLTPNDIHDLFFDNRTDDLSAFETIHYIHAVKK